jgi:hypothetical protein
VTSCSKESWLRGLATCFIWSSLAQQRKFPHVGSTFLRVVQDQESRTTYVHGLGGADGRSHASCRIPCKPKSRRPMATAMPHSGFREKVMPTSNAKG